MSILVRDSPSASRYEIYDGEQLAGFAAYTLSDRRIAFTHTEVVPPFGGLGLAGRLVAEALEDARRQGRSVLPVCPYVLKVIANDPGTYLELVPVEDRARFGLDHITD